MNLEKRIEKLEEAASARGESEQERLLREELAGMTDAELREARARAEAECRRLGIPEDEPPPSMTREQWADLRRAMLLADLAEMKANGITLTDCIREVARSRGEKV